MDALLRQVASGHRRPIRMGYRRPGVRGGRRTRWSCPTSTRRQERKRRRRCGGKGYEVTFVRCDVADEARWRPWSSHGGHLRKARRGVQQRRRQIAAVECRDATSDVRPRHGRQPSRRLELHEVRVETNAQARERGGRQQLVDRRAHRHPRAGDVSRRQARSPRAHQECGARVRIAWNPDQRGVPRTIETPMVRDAGQRREATGGEFLWRSSPSAGSAGPRRWLLPSSGCAAPERAWWSATGSQSTADTRRNDECRARTAR